LQLLQNKIGFFVSPAEERLWSFCPRHGGALVRSDHA